MLLALESGGIAVMKRINCTSSGKTANIACKLKLVDRYTQSLSIKLDVIEETYEALVRLKLGNQIARTLISYFCLFKVTFDLKLRMTTNWRQISHAMLFDLCTIEQYRQFPVVGSFYGLYQLIAPNLPSSCPMKSGVYFQDNVKVNFSGSIRFPQNPLVKDVQLPNGLYKFNFLVHNKADENLAQIVFLLEVRDQSIVTEL